MNEEAVANNKSIIVHQGSSRCFTGDTLVLTEKGHKPIKEISEGEVVYSWDNNLKKLVKNKIINKFIYKVAQPILCLKLKNGTEIRTTANHKFLYRGKYEPIINIAKRSMERNTRHRREIFYKQLREIKNYELQEDRTRKDNETSIYEKEPSKKKRFISQNNDKKEGICNNPNPPISRKGILSESREQTRSKSYKWDTMRQPSRELRMDDPLREHITLIPNRHSKTKKRDTERKVQTNRKTSNRDINKIRPPNRYHNNVIKRVWSFINNNKNNSRDEQESRKREMVRIKGKISAQEIRQNQISELSFKIYKKPVYDLEVENTKSYLITENNIIVHNSSKTYNILIWIIVNCLSRWDNELIDIFRKTFPSLRVSAMHDFFEILKNNNLYNEENHNKSENTYRIRSNLIRFGSVDQEMKVRGAGRSYLFLNEANEFTEDDFKQLNQRTTKLTILDYNPSDEFHWIYDKVIPREDTAFYKTTYLDNPFISDRVKKEIEAYKGIDENYWRVYGLGERGISQTTIFTHWDYYENEKFDGEITFGLDFGYNHPTALVKTKYTNGLIYTEELLYKSNLTSENLISELNKLVENGNLKYDDLIIADSSRPEMIEEIKRNGFNIHPTEKGKDSVLRGINFMKINKLLVNKNSVNLIKELKSYKWKVDKNGQRLDIPVELGDDLMDATRYSLERVSKNIEKPRLKFG